MEKNIASLKSDDLTPRERHALDRENDRNKLGFDTSVERSLADATVDALLEGVEKAHPSDSMKNFSDMFNSKGQARWAYSVLARMTDYEEEMPGECDVLSRILNGLPDQKEAEVIAFSSIVDENGETVNTPYVPPEKKMKKDLSLALRTYLAERIEVKLKDLEKGTLTRPERVSLVNSAKGCTTDLFYGSASPETMHRAYAVFCRGLEAADPGTGITDLPSSFSDPGNAYKVYITLLPDATRDEEIGPEWQKFKTILQAMGGEQNLDQVTDAYIYAKKQENEGFGWDDILLHVLTYRTMGEDYHTIPIRPGGEDLLSSTVEMEENDDEFMIDGIKLRKNTGNDD